MIRRRLPPPTAMSASDILELAASKPKPPRRNTGDFKKGNKAWIGRRMRGANRHTQIMREAVIIAMQDCAKGLMHKRGLPYSGVVGYLTWAAEKEPAAFLAFIAKAVLPVQIKHDLTMDSVIEVRFKHVEDIKAEFTRRGLPLPSESVFQLAHHADIGDAAESSPMQPAAPAAPLPTTPSPAAPAEVLPPAKPRLPAHLQRFSVTPALYREDLQ
jgi:hypothetical protein